ncbi:hypothetical protein SSYRP_v1c07430 [Spiroplasma syrphidicola EA-1]|uniref:Uncharacterized protein n=1 Tax=Spiroplasma syrphidicola EA-1 TaxID=1276229 RepID=R4U6T1_9MOLU|nr:hypothetical protein [Spiroplasma syrphidicola]AGM26333.1 hypothetical protein SSYRP_v1c07430 [Spiroplasma syrphidicola EA-1]
MNNKIQLIYNKMCYDCQFKFRNIISYVKNNREKNLNDLDLFKCKVDKTRDVLDDKNILPLALIFCRQDSYVFIWKDSIYNGDGTTKIPVINNTILLSQQTIHKIKDYNLVSNSLTTTKKQQMLVPKIIEKNNHALKQSFSRQMTLIHRQHFLHMSKMRKTIMLLSLVFILMFAAMGGFLSWYFLSGQNNSGSIINPSKQRIDLNEHLADSQLDLINDNRENSILQAAKKKNKKLDIQDLLVKNITDTNAVIYVKSSSNIYNTDSTVIVSFLPTKISLLTHVIKRNFFINTNSPNPPELLKIIKLENPKLVLDYVNIENIITVENNQIILKGNLVSQGEKSIYVSDESLELYFSNTDRKMLSNDLTEINLGDIKNYKSKTILEAVKLKNKNVLIDQVEVIPGNVVDKEAKIKVKSNSKDYYINDSYLITVEFRSFNKELGQIKEKVENDIKISDLDTAFELENNLILVSGWVENKGQGTHLFSLDGKYVTKVEDQIFNKIIKTPDNNILMGLGYSKGLFLLDSRSGKIIKKVEDNPNNPLNDKLGDIIFLHNGTILGISSEKNPTLYQLNADGTLLKQIKKYDDISYTYLYQLENGSIFLTSNLNGEEIIQLNKDYSIQKKIFLNPPGVCNAWGYSLLQSENSGIILLGGAAQTKCIYHLYSDLSLKEQTGFPNEEEMQLAIKLKSGTFLGFRKSYNGDNGVYILKNE